MNQRFRIILLVVINLVAIVALFYMLDFFGIVNYYSVLRSRLTGEESRPQDLYLLEKEELSKMQLAFDERASDLQVLEENLEEKSKELIAKEEAINEENAQIKAQWASISNESAEAMSHRKVISDLANSWGNMPPDKTAAIIVEHAKNGEHQLIIEVLQEMDRLAEQNGQSSIKPYLLSILPADVSATLSEKLAAQASPL